MTLSPIQKKKVRAAITTYCTIAEANRLRRHYSRFRPIRGLGLPPDAYQMDDCSGFDAKTIFWAMHQTGIWLPDPLNEHWTGWGYTGTQYDYLKDHPAPPEKFLVGDMAIMGTPSNTVHTMICRKAGNTNTAIFTSHGHESWIFDRDAPEPVSLTHAKVRQALVGVFRLPALL